MDRACIAIRRMGFTPVFTDTYEKADRGLRSVHVEAKEVQRRVQARCY